MEVPLRMTLTKATIAEQIQNELGLSNKEALKSIETVLETIKEDLTSGHDVMISGFGKFNVKEKKARRGRNPATGEEMTLDARRVITFTCSKKLRDKVNGGR